MPRSLKKGPFIHPSLIKKVEQMNAGNERRVIKTWSRASMIVPDMIGHTHCRARRPQAHPGVHHREYGRTPSRGVRPDPALPRARAPYRALVLAEVTLGERGRSMQAKAVARYIRMSPIKVRRVVRLIQGLPLRDAQALLDSQPHMAARVMRKVLDSAAANAENNHGMARGDLWVERAFVDAGPHHEALAVRLRRPHGPDPEADLAYQRRAQRRRVGVGQRRVSWDRR